MTTHPVIGGAKDKAAREPALPPRRGEVRIGGFNDHPVGLQQIIRASLAFRERVIGNFDLDQSKRRKPDV